MIKTSFPEKGNKNMKGKPITGVDLNRDYGCYRYIDDSSGIGMSSGSVLTQSSQPSSVSSKTDTSLILLVSLSFH